MIASTGLMLLAIYVKPSKPPDTNLNPPMSIQEEKAYDRRYAEPASSGQQTTSDGVVRDEGGEVRVDTGLAPDPEAGGRIVLPRE